MTLFIEGDCLETLKTLPDRSIQTCVTSPPYYGLRDYGVDGQIGLEETPQAYVEKLVAVFREVRRVLKDDGTLWVNLGDSYNSDSSNQQSGTVHRKRHDENGTDRIRHKAKGLKPKDLIGIPWMVAFALRADGWWLRSEIIWHKPNPMPESVTDRCTKAHEYIFLLAKSQKYYYDADAIAEPAAYDGRKDEEYKGGDKDVSITAHTRWNKDADGNRVRNKRSVWTVTTKPYKEAHFATFPPDLIEPCILAGSKVGDTVLDPFGGSGTTAAVSIKYHREAIICELNPKYIKLAKKRLSQVQPTMDGLL